MTNNGLNPQYLESLPMSEFVQFLNKSSEHNEREAELLKKSRH